MTAARHVTAVPRRSDVIVIGAGLGGLAAAVALAHAGHGITVVEQGEDVGGFAQTFARGPYRFETSIHAVDGACGGGWASEVFDQLRIATRLDFVRLDPFYAIHFDGQRVSVPADLDAYVAQLARLDPTGVDALRACFADLKRIFGEARVMLSVLDDARARRVEDRERGTALLRLARTPLAAWLAPYVPNHGMRRIVGLLSLYFGLEEHEMNALQFACAWASYHHDGAWYPRGGSSAIARALVDELAAAGGQVLLRRRVDRIEVQSGRTHAVWLDSGERIETSCVVSNASLPATIEALGGLSNVSPEIARAASKSRGSTSAFTVFAGITRDLPREHGLAAQTIVAEIPSPQGTAGTLDAIACAPLTIAWHGREDPDSAPPGTAAIALTVYAPWSMDNIWGTAGKLDGYRRNRRYQDLKRELGDRLVDRAEALLPGLRNALDGRWIATPLTFHRYTLSPEGSIYGAVCSPDVPWPARLDAASDIPGLYFAGAWTRLGCGVSSVMRSGVLAAQKARGELERSRRR